MFKPPFILFVLFLFVYPTSQTQAQDREFGIRLANLQNFGLIYKKNKVSHWTRWHASFAGLDADFSEDVFNGRLDLGFSVGKEKRKAVGEKMNFIHGSQFLLGLSLRSNNSNFNGTTSLGYGYLIGMNLELPNSFVLSLETIPRINVVFNGNSDFLNTSISADFNS
ncbi:MAG: hypothetical protein HKN16_05260, partial [Saprospiraceae bacterium]|nr:hypothetical protein [Saprospiraceae bacterium]